MAKFFSLQIRMGNLTLDQVPEKWREEVKKALNDVSETASCM